MYVRSAPRHAEAGIGPRLAPPGGAGSGVRDTGRIGRGTLRPRPSSPVPTRSPHRRCRGDGVHARHLPPARLRALGRQRRRPLPEAQRELGLPPHRRRVLPRVQDKDPTWRATAFFTLAEVEQLISDERVAGHRRIRTSSRPSPTQGRRMRSTSTGQPRGRPGARRSGGSGSSCGRAGCSSSPPVRRPVETRGRRMGRRGAGEEKGPEARKLRALRTGGV